MNKQKKIIENSASVILVPEVFQTCVLLQPGYSALYTQPE